MDLEPPRDLQQTDVAIPSGGQILVGRLVQPRRVEAPTPGLLLLHEFGGINRSLLATALRLAEQGYSVLLPDLYAGVAYWRALVQLVAGVALAPLRNRPLANVRAALAVLRQQALVDARRVGVVGYSMGAAYALQVACVERGVLVAALFCGQLPRPAVVLRHAPAIVASYAGRDLTTIGQAARLGRLLRQYGIDHDLKTYPQAAHAFYDPYGPMYDAGAADDAWQRTLAFVGHHLRSGPPGGGEWPPPRRAVGKEE